MHTLGFSPTRSVCITSHGSFVKALIINYYDDREILRIVFKELGLNQAIELLDDYILPVHMSKGRLMDFIRNPKYLENGENYEWGACNYIRLKGYPLSEWCKNPYINDPDVEEEILKTIREKRGKVDVNIQETYVDSILVKRDTIITYKNKMPLSCP